MIDPAILIALSGSVITLCAAGISVHRADKQRRFWRGEALAEAKNARDAINKADANEAIRKIVTEKFEAERNRAIRAENQLGRIIQQRQANLEKGRRTQAQRRAAATGTKSATFAGLKNGAAA